MVVVVVLVAPAGNPNNPLPVNEASLARYLAGLGSRYTCILPSPLSLPCRDPEFDLVNDLSSRAARWAGMPKEMSRNTPPGTNNL
jgi:hypothetical protein